MNKEQKEMLNQVDGTTKFKMVFEDGKEKEMNIVGLIETILNDNKSLAKLVNKLQRENKQLKERIKKARELIENDYFEDGSFENEYEVMRLLKGDSNE